MVGFVSEYMISEITKKEIVELSKKLIGFKSISSDQEKVWEVQEYLRSYIISKIDCDVQVFEKEGVRSYYYTHKDVTGKNICLSGHVDVVPASDDEFLARSDDTYIYGRGAGDMKSSVATMAILFINNPNLNISLLITGDEEIGSDNGAGYVNSLIKPDVVVVTEFSNNKLVLTEKGGLWLDVHITGPGGHASRPWKAVNCIDALMDLIEKIRVHFPRLTEQNWCNTLNVGSFIGGETVDGELGSPNKIADNASARLDFRLVEGTDPGSIFDQVHEVAESFSEELGEDFEINLNVNKRLDLMHTARDDPNVYSFLSAMEKCGLEKKIVKTAGGSDGRFFSILNIPVLIFGPSSIDHHSHDEKVRLDTVFKTYEVLETFVKSEYK